MNEIVPIDIEIEWHDGVPVITSLEISAKYGKRHGDVLRAIQNLEMSDEFRQRNFASADYLDAQGKLRPMCRMTRDGSWALTMTFTGKEAAALREKIVQALNFAEQAARAQQTGGAITHYTGPELLRLAAERIENQMSALADGHAEMKAERDAMADENARMAEALHQTTEAFDKAIANMKWAADKAYAAHGNSKKLLAEVKNKQPGSDLFAPKLSVVPKR